jgi:hypothetical protein
MNTMEVTPNEVLKLIAYGQKKGFIVGVIATVGTHLLVKNRKTLFGNHPLVK